MAKKIRYFLKKRKFINCPRCGMKHFLKHSSGGSCKFCQLVFHVEPNAKKIKLTWCTFSVGPFSITEDYFPNSRIIFWNKGLIHHMKSETNIPWSVETTVIRPDINLNLVESYMVMGK